MDRAAIGFLKILENEDKIEGTDRPVVDLGTKMRVFEKAQDWLLKRSRAKPNESQADDAGIAALRGMMEDPFDIVAKFAENPEFHAALKKRGWLPPLSKKSGRPNAQEARERAELIQVREQRVKAHDNIDPAGDDSALRKMLNGDAK